MDIAYIELTPLNLVSFICHATNVVQSHLDMTTGLMTAKLCLDLIGGHV